ncbi:hypothetical protein [Paenibacillus polymyxa]|nr:hypothetical protein [Paenibacillus polymyxa]
MQNYRIIEQEEKLRATTIENEMCYTRIWDNIDGALKINSGHCSTVK